MAHMHAQSQSSAYNARWHGKGFRENGCMWLRVQFGTDGFMRGRLVHEDASISDFLAAIRSEIGVHQLAPTWVVAVQYQKRPLVASRMRIAEVFDGGEAVYCKVFDGHGHERIFNGQQWVVRQDPNAKMPAAGTPAARPGQVPITWNLPASYQY